MTLGISPIFPIADYNGHVLNHCVFCILKEQNYTKKKGRDVQRAYTLIREEMWKRFPENSFVEGDSPGSKYH